MTFRSAQQHFQDKLKRHLLDALDQRGFVLGLHVEVRRPGQCKLRQFEESMPGPGEVLIETVLSAISPGTERAAYLSLGNVPFDYPHLPGSSLIGRVVAGGRGCRAPGGRDAPVALESSAVDLNLYPEPHRRGLRVRAGRPFEHGPPDVEDWRRAARRIARRVTLGRLDRLVA